MWRSKIAVLSLFVIAMAFGHCTGSNEEEIIKQKEEKKPNILIMLADDLGIGDIGCFGNTSLPTPHIDSIARDGVKMNHFLAASALCSPSRAAFLTGRYPVRSGMEGKHWNPVNLLVACRSGIPSYEVTFAEVARQAGYRTALIGKWHMGLHENWRGDNVKSPLNQGFDYFFGTPGSNMREYDDREAPTLALGYPNAKTYAYSSILAEVLFFGFLYRKKFIGFKPFFALSLFLGLIIYYPIFIGTHLKFLNSMWYRNNEIVEQPIILEGMTERLVNEGVEFIEKSQKEGKPFLLFMSWLQVHTALYAGPRFRGKSKHGKYGDEVMEMDWSVGEMLNALEERGIVDNTLVFFSSDQGGHVEEHGRDKDRQGGYNGIYRGGKLQGGMDGGIRVPTVMKWPGKIKAGKVLDVPLSNMDLFTTVAHVVGVEPPRDRQIDGKDLVPLLTGETDECPHDFLIHYCTDIIHAVRFKPDSDGIVWKVRYNTVQWREGSEGCDFACRCNEMDNVFHDPPLVFDMTNNPREDRPISQTHPKHNMLVKRAADVISKHKAEIVPVEDQMSLLNSFWRPHLQPCCNFPYCSCRDTKH